MHKELSKQTAFVQMRVEGKTLIDIADELEISVSTANRWSKLFKSEIYEIRNTELINLRKKIASRYEQYFDFLNSHFLKLNEEIKLHEEITMSYEDLLKHTLKILDAINKIAVFKKFSEKIPRDRLASPDMKESVMKESDMKESVEEKEHPSSYISSDQLEKLKRL